MEVILLLCFFSKMVEYARRKCYSIKNENKVAKEVFMCRSMKKKEMR